MSMGLQVQGFKVSRFQRPITVALYLETLKPLKL